MDELSTLLEEYVPKQEKVLGLFTVFINLIIAGILSFILTIVYSRFGQSLSNRKMFSRTFVIIAMTTMLVVTVVKSSLALSLGLVGALSIIRFRTAIKEPEELAFIFINISIGVGLGANQVYVTVISFFLLMIVVIVKGYFTKADQDQNLILSLSAKKSHGNQLEEILSVLKEHCPVVTLRRFDETETSLEAVFTIELTEYPSLFKIKSALNQIDSSIRISFLDSPYTA